MLSFDQFKYPNKIIWQIKAYLFISCRIIQCFFMFNDSWLNFLAYYQHGVKRSKSDKSKSTLKGDDAPHKTDNNSDELSEPVDDVEQLLLVGPARLWGQGSTQDDWNRSGGRWGSCRAHQEGLVWKQERPKITNEFYKTILIRLLQMGFCQIHLRGFKPR